MPPTPTTLRAYEIDEDSGDRSPIGFLNADKDGMLRLISAESDDDTEILEEVIGLLNKQPDIKIRVPPPPGAERFELHSEIVERGTPGFLDALREYTLKYHDIDLEPTKDTVIDAEPTEYRTDPFRPSAGGPTGK